MSGLSREEREEERGFPFWRSWLGKEKRRLAPGEEERNSEREKGRKQESS